MKKLVTLVAVLALASLASAAMMTFQAVGGNSVVAGNVLTINVVSDTASTSFTLNVKSNITPAHFTLGTVNIGFTTVNSPGAIGNGVNGLVIYNAAGSNSTNVAAGTWYTFTVDTAGLAGQTITFDSMTSNNGSGSNKSTKLGITSITMPQLSVSVTPEPMTLALLGLGGLFLRRKSA